MNILLKDDKPWDAHLAFRMVYPLRNSRIQPNHLTSLRLCFGLLSALLFSMGDTRLSNLAAFAFLISSFLDHADGELARLTGSSSTFGHYYDLACDAIVNTFLFIGIGIGLSSGEFGPWSVSMGSIAGISISCIFHLRNNIENKIGKTRARQPNFAGFEAEDILYLLPVVTFLNGLETFLLTAAIGAPCFALFVIYEFRKLDQVRA